MLRPWRHAVRPTTCPVAFPTILSRTSAFRSAHARPSGRHPVTSGLITRMPASMPFGHGLRYMAGRNGCHAVAGTRVAHPHHSVDRHRERRLTIVRPDFYHRIWVRSGAGLWPAGLQAEAGGFAH
jgi:hypothetical protein